MNATATIAIWVFAGILIIALIIVKARIARRRRRRRELGEPVDIDLSSDSSSDILDYTHHSGDGTTFDGGGGDFGGGDGGGGHGGH